MSSTLPSANPCCDNACSGLSINVLSSTVATAGNGPPEGVVTGVIQGQLYTDLLTGTLYKFIGTVGTKLGWI